jgi:metal-sulfur cluster biosynthetic enzyme
LNDLETKVFSVVGAIIDPETHMTFAQMKMIRRVEEIEPGVVDVEFVPSSPFCPIAIKLAQDIKNKMLSVEGVTVGKVYCRGHVMEQQINEMINKQ